MSHHKCHNTDTLIVPNFMAEDDGSPADIPVQDYPDDMDDELTNISHQTLQDVLGTLQTPPSVTRRSTEQAAITEDPPTTPIVRPTKEVWVGMQNMAASLEGMRSCMMSSADQAAALRALTSILQGLQQTVKEFTTAVRELPQHLAPQTFHCMHECNHDLLKADLAAYHRDVAAILKNQQILLAAVLPLRPPQVAATGMSDSTSTHTEVCVAPSQPPPPRTEEATHTSEDEDMEQITFTRKSTRKH
ncbi:hypothetical protein NDU88_001420 [Pleurodeles waltl]|uniref:Uncharacterized protein n=1 Tax=Pleurodeles waltl TaxID=8319 RepID=A0AAV7USQ9_PLEWA|nr:hypothetical protein NDU88_001420 [Pleurodeles waltl]